MRVSLPPQRRDESRVVSRFCRKADLTDAARSSLQPHGAGRLSDDEGEQPTADDRAQHRADDDLGGGVVVDPYP